jgi:hypothetical protein
MFTICARLQKVEPIPQTTSFRYAIFTMRLSQKRATKEFGVTSGRDTSRWFALTKEVTGQPMGAIESAHISADCNFVGADRKLSHF